GLRRARRPDAQAGGGRARLREPPGHRARAPVSYVAAGLHEAPGHSRGRRPHQAREGGQGRELHPVRGSHEEGVRLARRHSRVLGEAPRRACPVSLSPTGDKAMANTKTQERPSLALVRKFDAAPGKVWRALTDPEMLKQWMRPNNATQMSTAEIDLRVGG